MPPRITPPIPVDDRPDDDATEEPAAVGGDETDTIVQPAAPNPTAQLPIDVNGPPLNPTLHAQVADDVHS
jgi:hypothetical protein